MISDAALASELAENLTGSPHSLANALSVVQEELGVDRVSLSRIDKQLGTFRIVAAAGAALLVPGTELPLEVSSYFYVAACGEVFDAPDFGSDKFSRPLDSVVAGSGFGSGAAFPLYRGTSVVGAIALSGHNPAPLAERFADQLVATSAVLTMAMRESTRPPLCLVILDDPVLAEGLARILERVVTARPVICVGLNDAVATIANLTPSVIVVDDHIQGIRCDQAIDLLRRSGTAAPVVVLASRDTPQNLRAAVNAGAAGYIPLHDAARSFASTMQSVLSGRSILPLTTTERPTDPLTPRELEVLRAFGEGLTLRQVARRLRIAEPTAKSHTQNLFRKLGVHNRIEALTAARDEGYMPR